MCAPPLNNISDVGIRSDTAILIFCPTLLSFDTFFFEIHKDRTSSKAMEQDLGMVN